MKHSRGSPTFRTPRGVQKRISLRQQTPDKILLAPCVLRLSQPMKCTALLVVYTCRRKVTGWLAKKFKSPKLAEVCYNYCNSSSIANAACAGGNFKPTTVNVSMQTDDVDESVLAHLFKALPINKQLDFLSKRFLEYMLVAFSVILSEDLLIYTAKAMSHLGHN